MRWSFLKKLVKLFGLPFAMPIFLRKIGSMLVGIFILCFLGFCGFIIASLPTWASNNYFILFYFLGLAGSSSK